MIDPSIIPSWAYPILGIIFLVILGMSYSGKTQEQKKLSFASDELTISRNTYGDFQVVVIADNEAVYMGNFGDCCEWVETHLFSDEEQAKWSIKKKQLEGEIFQ